MRLSRQGRAVLETLVQEPSGRRLIYQLESLRLLGPAHGSLPTIRASLSRTLRRLWRAGLVELANDYGWTLSEQHHALDVELAEHEADPAGAYADVLAAIARGVPGFFGCGSAEAYLAHHRWLVSRRRRHIRNTSVTLSVTGREYIERLTARRRTVNRKDNTNPDNRPSDRRAS